MSDRPKPTGRQTVRVTFSVYPQDLEHLEACRLTMPDGQKTNSDVIRMFLRQWAAAQPKRRKGEK